MQFFVVSKDEMSSSSPNLHKEKFQYHPACIYMAAYERTQHLSLMVLFYCQNASSVSSERIALQSGDCWNTRDESIATIVTFLNQFGALRLSVEGDGRFPNRDKHQRVNEVVSRCEHIHYNGKDEH